MATDDSLLRADVLVCDCSGVALEYALGTERPVIFIDVPVKIQNERFEELGIEPVELALRPLMGVIVPTSELDTLPERVEEMLAARDEYRDRLAELRAAHVYHFGQSSAVGADHIAGLLETGGDAQA